MPELKCPICNSNLIITRLCDGIFPNPHKGEIDEIFCDECKMHGTKELWQALIDTKKKLDRAIRVIQEVSKMSDKLSRKYGDTLVEQLYTIQAFCWEQGYILTHDEDFKQAEQINEITKGGKDEL